MRSSKYRDSEKPDLQFTLRYPSESDKLRLCSGTVLQKEVTKRERRRLERERTREKELPSKSSKITSSSNAMDTDEAGKHAQNILARVNRQQEDDKLATTLVEISSTKEPEHSTEDTQEDSDLDTTILDNLKIPGRFSDDLMVKEGLGEPLGEIDADLQRSFTRTLRHGTPPPSLGISPTTTKLMFGLSKSLEKMSLNPSDEKRELRTNLGMGYANNEFYLPIAGCPSVSELEPQLTDQLTLKGNRAKLLHIPLWHHTYYTSLYLIDEVTGELYACHQGELIAIKDLLRPHIRYLGTDVSILSLQAMCNIYKVVAHNLKMACKRLEKEAIIFPSKVKTEDLIMLKRHDKKTFELMKVTIGYCRSEAIKWM